MSCLKLYWPQTLSLYRPSEADWGDDPAAGDAPVILRFSRAACRLEGGRQTALLARAREIFANRCCPECGRATVVPVDSAPSRGRERMPVPGASRLAGFECDCCGYAWKAASQAG